jgi:hypothetical protein
MRLHAQTAMIENGFVHIPEAAPWLVEYLHEMTGGIFTRRSAYSRITAGARTGPARRIS